MLHDLNLTMANRPYFPFDDDDKIKYRQFSKIRRILVGNDIVDHSDVVGASPVGGVIMLKQKNSTIAP